MGPHHHALILRILVLAIVLSVSSTGGAAGAGDASAAGTPVTISGPAEVVLEGGEGTEFQLHVSSRIDCRSGLEPPRDLVMFPAQPTSERGDGTLWRITPDSVRLAWEPAHDQKDVYLLDTIVTFNVTSEEAPPAPTEEDAVMLLEELDGDPGIHCRVNGYALDAEEHGLSFLVVPQQDVQTAAAVADGEPPVRWIPMFLAIGILAALAGFATVRERQRRRG